MEFNKNINPTPLVTLILVSYNQETLVEAAVNSLFSQDYNPLEIILSDDCSTDGTFQILEGMVNNYDGSHKVWLNRNPINLGIGKHWDFISRQARGELIIHAAGDDISIPTRVSVLVKAWMSAVPHPTMISSDGMIMTYDGKPVRRHIGSRWPEKVQVQRTPRQYDLDILDVPRCGFSLAIDRHLYETFEPIQDYLWSEDQILTRRALLLQGIMYIPDVLVFYRDGGLSKGVEKNQYAYMSIFLNHTKTRLSVVRQAIRDIKILPLSEAAFYLKKLNRQKLSAERCLHLIRGNFAISVIMLFLQIIAPNSNIGSMTKTDYLRFFMVKWMPEFFFLLRNIKVYLMKYK